MGVRRARLGVALLAVRRLVVDLAAQVIEALAVWPLAHDQPGLDAASTRLGALGRDGNGSDLRTVLTISKICLLLYRSSPNTSRKEETGKSLKEINP